LRPGITGANITVTGQPGLHAARQPAIERCDRDRRVRQARLAHLAQDVGVADDQVGLGDDAQRVAKGVQNLQHLAGDPQPALDRLVGVGVGADLDVARPVPLLRQLGGQQARRLRFEEQPALEVEAGREAQVGVRRPGEAVDAAVLAAPVGIDRAVEVDVGTAVAGDDCLRHVRQDGGGQLGRLGVVQRPAVVEGLALGGDEAAGRVAAGATTFDEGRGGGHGRSVRGEGNITRTS
jgi:hypothetical protein